MNASTTPTTVVGKTILITGASSGIGASCARFLGAAGARLILAARREEKLQALAQELSQGLNQTVETLLLPLDVREPETVSRAVAGLPGEWAAIDILINNAGLSRGIAKQQEAPLLDWEEMIDTNIKGLLYVTRAVVPGMVARGRGHVVNLGSIAARQTYPGGSVYCATKAAVKALSEGLKMDLLGTPIRVTNIEPGLVETEFSNVRFRGDDARADAVYEGMTPLTPDDIADCVLFAVTRPAHVNLSEILLMPTDQASASLVARRAE